MISQKDLLSNQDKCELCCKRFNLEDEKNKIICKNKEPHKYHELCLYKELCNRNASSLDSICCPSCLSDFHNFKVMHFNSFNDKMTKICIICKKAILSWETEFKISQGWCHLDCNPMKIVNLLCFSCKKEINQNPNQNYLLVNNGYLIHLDCFESNISNGNLNLTNDGIHFSSSNFPGKQLPINYFIFTCNCSFNMDDIRKVYFEYENKLYGIHEKENNFELCHKSSCLNQHQPIKLSRNIWSIFNERYNYMKYLKSMDTLKIKLESNIDFANSALPECFTTCYFCLNNENNVKLYPLYGCKHYFLCMICIFKYS